MISSAHTGQQDERVIGEGTFRRIYGLCMKCGMHKQEFPGPLCRFCDEEAQLVYIPARAA